MITNTESSASPGATIRYAAIIRLTPDEGLPLGFKEARRTVRSLSPTASPLPRLFSFLVRTGAPILLLIRGWCFRVSTRIPRKHQPVSLIAVGVTLITETIESVLHILGSLFGSVRSRHHFLNRSLNYVEEFPGPDPVEELTGR